ncbi:MAG: hypothetical protein ACR2KP_09930 [Egibacteraceae bacterium]
MELVIAADAIEADRVNLFEQWDSEQRLAAWQAVADPLGASQGWWART